MTKLNLTPLARRRPRDQLLDLSEDPEKWQSDHLRRAFEIIAKRKSRETAKQIVLESVRAADCAVKKASERCLKSSRQSALTDFDENCRAIANCTKPTRLRSEIRTRLDEAARSAFVGNGIDLEVIQNFFCLSKKIVECWPENKDARAIFKHLVTIKGDITHRAEFPLEGRVPKIALDYEALPTQARLTCEHTLHLLIAEKSENLTAHDIFASFYAASHSLVLTQNLQDEPGILDIYLAEIERIWTDKGLRVGRGNHHANADYMSPFQEFAERALLVQRDPGSRIFTPFTEHELKSARELYHRIPPTSRANISAAPFMGTWVITDRLLRSYFERSSKKST
jgi:hypothetical protein